MKTTLLRRDVLGLTLVAVLLAPAMASAQLDPLLYLKRKTPNVLIAVDTADRMQRDTNGDYLDNNKYPKKGDSWESALGLTSSNTSSYYRRKYVGLAQVDTSGGYKFSTDHIEIVGDRDAAYSTFEERTRIAIARRSLAEAITRNASVVRFGLLRTRQSSPRYEPHSGGEPWEINNGPTQVLNSAWPAQQTDGDDGVNKWKITRPLVNATNGSIAGPVGPLVAADAVNANTSILSILGLATGVTNSLIPAGGDTYNTVDAPVDNMLDDLKQEATRLIAADTNCCNTVAILVTGGGEGTTTNENPVTKAAQFLNISGRRVPVYVIAIAPISATERTQLQGIAAASGGQFTEITAAMVQATTAGQPVPEFVRAVNVAVSHAFGDPADVNLAPDAQHPYGYETNHQVTSPIVGSVNLKNAVDINGSALPNTSISNPLTGTPIPQRSNVMITSGYSLPGFVAKLKAVRLFKPVADITKPSGYKFVADGTKLWEAAAPAAASRNIYTALPDGTVVSFDASNASALRTYLKVSDTTAAAALIDFIRSQPLGAIIGSTPAIMDAPSLDPPPDADYPGFVTANQDRRSMIWVGANDGMLHGIDARLGKEVWAFIPFNLLPKLNALRSGQPVGDFRFYVDGSPKIADVKVGGQWRTYLVMGEGPGGTFYQTFDVTLPNMGLSVAQDSDNLGSVLSYFASTSSVPLKWAFPQYSEFDVNIGTWGDVAAGASAIAKTVGRTWSDPAVGQIGTASSPFTVLTGSGHLPWSVQQQANRGGVVAGNTFYILDAATGAVLDSRSVGSDGQGETIDNCAAAAVNDCRKLKNALQADPVATGAADERYISKVYVGDLDGKIWRFDVGLNGSGTPVIQQLLNIYSISTSTTTTTTGRGGGTTTTVTSTPADNPIFASMATVSIGNGQQYLFVGTGSDLLPQNSVSTAYVMVVVLDNAGVGTQKALISLEKTDGLAGDEKVTAFPAVAGDIVFFSTTTYNAALCTPPNANLYAFTFIGGPAYDTNGSGTLTSADTPKVRTTTGERATAPFIVDQHLVFGTGDSVELFGDPEDFNNGVGQVGVRILSWREVR